MNETTYDDLMRELELLKNEKRRNETSRHERTKKRLSYDMKVFLGVAVVLVASMVALAATVTWLSAPTSAPPQNVPAVVILTFGNITQTLAPGQTQNVFTLKITNPSGNSALSGYGVNYTASCSGASGVGTLNLNETTVGTKSLNLCGPSQGWNWSGTAVSVPGGSSVVFTFTETFTGLSSSGWTFTITARLYR